MPFELSQALVAGENEKAKSCINGAKSLRAKMHASWNFDMKTIISISNRKLRNLNVILILQISIIFFVILNVVLFFLKMQIFYCSLFMNILFSSIIIYSLDRTPYKIILTKEFLIFKRILFSDKYIKLNQFKEINIIHNYDSLSFLSRKKYNSTIFFLVNNIEKQDKKEIFSLLDKEAIILINELKNIIPIIDPNAIMFEKYKCSYCNQYFSFITIRDKHEEICEHRPDESMHLRQ
jgi:hypothetical protein